MNRQHDFVEAPDARQHHRGGPGLEKEEGGVGGEHFFEWCLGPAHVEVDDDVFVEAWTAFWRELSAEAQRSEK